MFHVGHAAQCRKLASAASDTPCCGSAGIRVVPASLQLTSPGPIIIPAPVRSLDSFKVISVKTYSYPPPPQQASILGGGGGETTYGPSFASRDPLDRQSALERIMKRQRSASPTTTPIPYLPFSLDEASEGRQPPRRERIQVKRPRYYQPEDAALLQHRQAVAVASRLSPQVVPTTAARSTMLVPRDWPSPPPSDDATTTPPHLREERFVQDQRVEAEMFQEVRNRSGDDDEEEGGGYHSLEECHCRL